MAETVSGGPVVTRGWQKPVKWILLLVLVILLGLLVYKHFHKSGQLTASAGNDLNQSQLESIKTQAAQKALDSKNYQSAVNSYDGASSNAFANKDYQKSKEILDECIKKVPDQYVPWTIYYALANTAHSLSDASLEKTSLQTAISKANQPGSGADQVTIKIMQSQLAGIK